MTLVTTSVELTEIQLKDLIKKHVSSADRLNFTFVRAKMRTNYEELEQEILDTFLNAETKSIHLAMVKVERQLLMNQID